MTNSVRSIVFLMTLVLCANCRPSEFQERTKKVICKNCDFRKRCVLLSPHVTLKKFRDSHWKEYSFDTAYSNSIKQKLNEAAKRLLESNGLTIDAHVVVDQVPTELFDKSFMELKSSKHGTEFEVRGLPNCNNCNVVAIKVEWNYVDDLVWRQYSGNIDTSSRMLYHKHAPRLTRLVVKVAMYDSSNGRLIYYNSAFLNSENNLSPAYYGGVDELERAFSPLLRLMK